jgi:hypothetical protein
MSNYPASDSGYGARPYYPSRPTRRNTYNTDDTNINVSEYDNQQRDDRAASSSGYVSSNYDTYRPSSSSSTSTSSSSLPYGDHRDTGVSDPRDSSRDRSAGWYDRRSSPPPSSSSSYRNDPSPLRHRDDRGPLPPPASSSSSSGSMGGRGDWQSRGGGGRGGGAAGGLNGSSRSPSQTRYGGHINGSNGAIGRGAMNDRRRPRSPPPPLPRGSRSPIRSNNIDDGVGGAKRNRTDERTFPSGSINRNDTHYSSTNHTPILTVDTRMPSSSTMSGRPLTPVSPPSSSTSVMASPSRQPSSSLDVRTRESPSMTSSSTTSDIPAITLSASNTKTVNGSASSPSSSVASSDTKPSTTPILTASMPVEIPEAPSNDYCQHFVDTGERPQNYIRDAGADRFHEYPKLDELVTLKNKMIEARATPPYHIDCDLKTFDLSSLGTKVR